MTVSFDGIGEKVLSFETQGKFLKGSLVGLSDNGIARLAQENEKFVGVVIESTEKLASVQIAGYAKLKFSGDIPKEALGCTTICADSAGGIKIDPKGRPVLLLEINGIDKEVGVII